ncbi:MAG TPA: endonuclease/exonuclease/phosphatase family protein [Polyangiaceae bacterium]|jgi:endonuclease/exonuclease/phosphatase family metal-dependent hydrolase
MRRHPIALAHVPVFALVACVLGVACGQASSGEGAAGSGADASSPAVDGSAGEDSGGDSGDEAAPAEAGAGTGTRVRIMAANLTSGTDQSYDTPGIDIFEGLHPDVVLVQEFTYASGTLDALVATAFGPDFTYYVEPRTGGIPNGVVSRYPIAESGVWADASTPDRAFVYARIDVPGSVDLWAVSVHLLTTGATERATEATALLGYVQSNVPPGDYLVIGGDFNTDTVDEQALATLSAVVVTAPPYPADQSGNTDSSINRNHPHDWVLAGPSLQARGEPVVIGSQSFAAGLVFDSRVYTPLADVAPVMLGDSGATGMQHMAVVRDFGM